MTIVIVKMSISKVKIAVLKNLLIFGEKYLPQSVRLLEGGWGVETLFGRMPFEHAVSLSGASFSNNITSCSDTSANMLTLALALAELSC